MVGHTGCLLAWRSCNGEPQHPKSAPLDPHNLKTTPHPGSWRGESAPVRAHEESAQSDGCVNLRKPGGAHNHKRVHDRGARPKRVLHPATRSAAREQVGANKNGAHNPTGASNPEHGAARTTEGVRPTEEHDPTGASPRNPTRRTRTSGRKNERGAQPEGCINLRKPGGAHNQKRAHDRGARPKGCFTQKPDAPHENKWAQKQTGRTNRRVRQPQRTGRRAQPKACARQGSTTQKGSSPSNPTRRTRESGR